MYDLYHSWGNSPQQKKREKEYNHEYYLRNKNRLLARKRRITGQSTVNKRPMGSSSSFLSTAGVSAPSSNPNTSGELVLLGENPTPYTQYHFDNTAVTQTEPPLQSVAHQLQIKEYKAAVDEVVRDAGHYLLTGNIFTAAATLGAVLVRNRLKAAGKW